MTSNSTFHFLLVPVQAWGHIKPQCHFALRLLATDDRVVITMLVSKRYFNKVHAEIAEYTGVSDCAPRIRVVCSSAYAGTDEIQFYAEHARSYANIYKALTEQTPISCLATGITYKPFTAPAVVVMDYVCPMVFSDTKALTGNTVPVYIWGTGALTNMMRIWGPEDMGGMGNIKKLAEEEAARTRSSVNKIGERMLRHVTGRLVELPGLIPAYDHELFPQDASGIPLFMIINSGYEIFEHCDGLITIASEAVEGEAVSSVKKWFSDAGKEVYNVGPLLPSAFWSVESDRGATDVRLFLGEMQAKYGESSVILISFGSFYWPPVQEYIDEVISTLIEKGVPFVFAHASSFSEFPPELLSKIKESGLGMLSSWIPQQYVLKHPAIGWFLTHGGQGGTTEALGAGVPLICWPINADQPLVAIRLVHIGVAFELIEVRSGENGLKPIHRLGGRKPEGTREAVGREIRAVIDAARGEVGREMRRKAQALKEELRRSWDVDGAAAKSMREFVKKVLP